MKKCFTCPVSEFCGTMVSTSRLCRAMDERVQTEAYIKNWLREQVCVPMYVVMAFIEELDHYERIYEEAIWADYLMYEALMRDF